MNIYEYQMTLVQYHSDQTFSIFFSLETATPIKTKFHMEPPWDRGTKVSSNGSGHMSNMATMHIYGKNLKKIFTGTKKVKVSMQHRVLEYYQISSNDYSGLTLTYFTARSNLVPYAFV